MQEQSSRCADGVSLALPSFGQVLEQVPQVVMVQLVHQCAQATGFALRKPSRANPFRRCTGRSTMSQPFYLPKGIVRVQITVRKQRTR